MKNLVWITLVLLVGCTLQPVEKPLNADAHRMQVPLVDRLENADRALKEARLTDAEVLYRALTEEHPRLPDVWLRLGNIYVRQDQLDAAEQSYRKGLRYRPEDSRLWHNLALVQTRQAIETLEMSVSMLAAGDPHLPRIQRLHGRLLEAGISHESTDDQGSPINETGTSESYQPVVTIAGE